MGREYSSQNRRKKDIEKWHTGSQSQELLDQDIVAMAMFFTQIG